MELRYLRHFLAVYELGSLGRAANFLHISEPALSKSIRRLEDLLQVRLLDRGPRGMTPTLFGDSLAEHARLIRSEVDHAIGELDELRGVSKGVIRIGARPSIGAIILPRAIARLQAERPGVKAIVREGLMANMIYEVIDGNLDFIVVTMSEEVPDPNLIQEPLADSPAQIVVKSDHPLTTLKEVKPSALRDYPWVLPGKSDPVRLQIDKLIEQNNIGAIDVLAETDSLFFTMSYLRETEAVSYIPEWMVMSEVGKSDFKILEVKGMKWQRKIGILRRRRFSQSPAARLLIQELHKECASLTA